MEDADDIEPEVDADADGDGDGDDEENDEDNGDDEADGGEEEDDSPDQPSLSQTRRPSLPTISTCSDNNTTTLGQNNDPGPTSHPHSTLMRTSPTTQQGSEPAKSPRIRLEVRPEALNASTYDIVPTMAAPQATSINAVTATPDFRYWFTGGSDCYIRKYDGVASVNGKTLLTVAQRHPFVDSVVKAGVLMSYWDNEEPASKSSSEEPALSPVYSLAVQSQALWVASGLESGCINLCSVRHDEGKVIYRLREHKSAVSVLTLTQDEKSLLSGSWDKNVFDWDLNEGKIRRYFEGSGGQISAIEIRPASSLPVPEESGEPVRTNGTFSSNNADKPLPNDTLTNGANGHADGEGNEDAQGSSADSLFGGGSDTNSLFGDNDGAGAPSGGHFGDDDDEFSRAIGVELDSQDRDRQGDISMGVADPKAVKTGNEPKPDQSQEANDEQTASFTQMNGIILEKGPDSSSTVTMAPETQDAVATSDSTFLAASIDGPLRVWDRRQPNPIARIPTRAGVPPWCMAACWSPDGNYIYAGRRNGTVEEFSLHKGLKTAERTFKFPQGSGAVTAVRAMPNGRHLIWYVFALS